MNDWSATVVSERGDAPETPHRVRAMVAASRLGGEAWLDVELEQLAKLLPLPMNTNVVLRSERLAERNVDPPQFVVIGIGAPDELGGGYMRLRRVDHQDAAEGAGGIEDGSEGLTLWQRPEASSVWDFLQSVGGESLGNALRVGDGVMTRIEEVCPELWCIATRVRAPGGSALKRVTDGLVGRGSGFVGLVRTVADSRYRPAGVYAEKGSKPRMDLASELSSWTLGEETRAGLGDVPGEAVSKSVLCADPIGSGTARRVHRSVSVGEPGRYAACVFDSKVRSLHEAEEGGKEIDPVPLGPCTVAVGEEVWFVAGTKVRIDLGGDGHRGQDAHANNVFGTLDLVRPEAQMAERRMADAATLLGVVAERPSHETVVLIKPLDEGSVESLDATVRPLTRWASGLENPISAWMAVPGFVRKSSGTAAFYAPLNAGDLLLFDVSASGAVVVRGALHQRMPEMEEAALTLAGDRIDMNANVRIAGEHVELRSEVQVVGKLDVKK